MVLYFIDYNTPITTTYSIYEDLLEPSTSLPEIDLDQFNSVNPSWKDHVINKEIISKPLDILNKVKHTENVDGFSYAKALSKNITTKTPNIGGIEISKNKFNILNVE